MTLFDLLCVGIGGTVGSGVFVLTGQVYPVAGPSATLSWVLAGCVCGLSALSYMELSSRIPTKGSCYAFSFHAIGEVPAVIAAVCLTLEYGLAGAGVARNWSAKLASLLSHFHAAKYMFVPYSSSVTLDDDDGDDDFYVDVPAGLLQVACVLVCVVGLKLGKVVINGFTVAKCALVVFMIVAGFAAWHVNVLESSDEFFPKGFGGTLSGTSLLFFGYIGFDEVCCLAGKAENPAQVMPRAIAGTLVGATVLSVLAQMALSGLVRFDDDGSGTSFEQGFDDIGWQWARFITAVGEVLLLPLVVLVSFLPQPELFAALAEDGLLPASFGHANSQGTLMHGTVAGGVVMTVFSMLVPFAVLWDMINLGVLLGFNLTNTSLLLVRYGSAGVNDGGTHEPYSNVMHNDHGDEDSKEEAALVAHHHPNSPNSPQPAPRSASKAAAVLGLGNFENESPSAQSVNLAEKCVSALWVCGVAGSYCSWLGLFKPLLNTDDDRDDGAPSPPLAAVGVLGLVCFGAAVVVLWSRCEQHPPPLPPPAAAAAAAAAASPVSVDSLASPLSPDELSPEMAAAVAAAKAAAASSSAPATRSFVAPGVPFTPSAAILFNFLLMAQYDAATHGYLLGLISMALVCYAAYKTTRTAPAAFGK